MNIKEIKERYCVDAMTLGDYPVNEYEVTFRLGDGPEQKAYAAASEDHPFHAADYVKRFQIPSQYQKQFHHTGIKLVKNLYKKAADAPKNWWNDLNKNRKISNLITDNGYPKDKEDKVAKILVKKGMNPYHAKSYASLGAETYRNTKSVESVVEKIEKNFPEMFRKKVK